MVIGEIFLTAFVQVLFEKLASRDLWNFGRRERIHTLFTKWKKMLEQIEAVLADAEHKQMTNTEGIKLWLEDLEDLAYDLDDVLDEFATEALHRKVMEESRASSSKVCALVPTCCTSFNPRNLAYGFRVQSQVDEITIRLQDLLERRMGLGLQNIGVGPSIKAPQRPHTSSLLHEPCLYGRDGDKRALIELLLSDQSSNENVGVIPIVGMGGVGKTTLAQMVYNDEMVKKHFEIKAWVCVSEVFEIEDVTKEILECVTSCTCGFKALNQVQEQLKEALAGRKFLIVLDDVWNKNYGDWTSLKSPFNGGALGSKVIVTTRNRGVALMMAGTDKYHPLKELSEDDCWSVFAQHAFGNRSIDPNLVSLGRKIVKRCGGLPLAARTLGGLLRCKLKDEEWEEVLNSKFWELSDEESDIIPALRLSYYHLPSHLKKCFGYCSVLPKGYKFEEKELVLWWMAEGLIQKPASQKQMEDLGCEYFHDLLSRSFFQLSSQDEVSLFVMHDLINDLAQLIAGRISYSMEKFENEGGKSITKARHSSYTRDKRDGRKKFEIFHKAKNLRSFLPFGLRDGGTSQSVSFLSSDVPLNLLPSLRRLRVLSLRRYRICEVSSLIGNLKHVRFLDLSYALVVTLPESISTLYNLQTLILRDCKNLSQLPASTSNLINLRHLDVTGAYSLKEMPPKIGKLTCLRTLSNFIVSQGNGSTIKELGNLIHLRGTLCISGLENVVDAPDAMRANLKDKQGLEVLVMKWSKISDNSCIESVKLEVLDMLRPHNKLKELTISGYHGLTLPSWVGHSFFSNMVCLKLQNCEKCIALPPLGQLTSLTKLHIQGMTAIKNIGLDFYGLGCPNTFQSLENLTFEDMPEWEDWSPFKVKEGAQAFSQLLELSIKSCPKLLQKLPSNLPCLRKLDIFECPLLEVAWVPSSAELNEVRNMLHFDSLTSLSLTNVSFPNSLCNPEVGDKAVLENELPSHLSSLTSLRIGNIQGLECLPNWFFQGLTRLQELSLFGCKELTSLWKNEVKQHHSLPAFRRFVVKSCTQLVSFIEQEEEEEGLQQHKELPYLMMLEHLKIEDCGKLEKLPQGLHDIKYLQELIIHGCPCLISFPKTGLSSTLRTLDIDYCGALQSLPDLMMLSSLEKLGVTMCPSLKYLSCSRTALPPTLKELYISSCGSLEYITTPAGMKINCPSLESVSIWDCESLKTLPDVMQKYSGGCLRNLSTLRVMKCENMESIPNGWFTATDLRKFCLASCKKSKGLPHHAYNNLISLEVMQVDSCTAAAIGLISYNLKEESYSFSFTKLTSLSLFDVEVEGKPPSNWGLHRLSSLRQLYLEHYGWVSFPPEEDDGMMMLLPPSLTKLSIGSFLSLKTLSCKDLLSLEQLHIGRCPKLNTIMELGQLPLLSELSIWDCPYLASLSVEEQRLRLPPSLLYLGINACPLLKQRCEKGKGQYWSLIAHIPQVEIDHRFIFDPSS